MAMAIAGAITNVSGIWMGINLIRSGRLAFRKILCLKEIVAGDPTKFFKSTPFLQMPLGEIENRSYFKTGCYFVVTALQISRVGTQKQKFLDSIERLKRDWTFYRTFDLPLSLREQPESDRVLQLKRVKRLGQNALKCLGEALILLQSMLELWDFVAGTDADRDRIAYPLLLASASQLFTRINELWYNREQLQEQLKILTAIANKIIICPFLEKSEISFNDFFKNFLKRDEPKALSSEENKNLSSNTDFLSFEELCKREVFVPSRSIMESTIPRRVGDGYLMDWP